MPTLTIEDIMTISSSSYDKEKQVAEISAFFGRDLSPTEPISFFTWLNFESVGVSDALWIICSVFKKKRLAATIAFRAANRAVQDARKQRDHTAECLANDAWEYANDAQYSGIAHAAHYSFCACDLAYAASSNPEQEHNYQMSDIYDLVRTWLCEDEE